MAASEVRRLGAGAQMRISDAEVSTRIIEPVEVDATLSWRQGELVFRGESLEYVVAEVCRYSNVNITFADDAIRAIPVGGVFETGDVDNLVDLLEHGFGVYARRADDGSIELTSNAPSKD